MLGIEPRSFRRTSALNHRVIISSALKLIDIIDYLEKLGVLSENEEAEITRFLLGEEDSYGEEVMS